MNPNSQWVERFNRMLKRCGFEFQDGHWTDGEYWYDDLVGSTKDFVAQELHAHATEQLKRFASEVKELYVICADGTALSCGEEFGDKIDNLLRKHTGEEK